MGADEEPEDPYWADKPPKIGSFRLRATPEGDISLVVPVAHSYLDVRGPMGYLVVEPGLFSGEIPAHRTILQVLLSQGIMIGNQCRRGMCGQDLIRVISGWEHLNPVVEPENGMLTLLNVAGKHMRMACCTRIIGHGRVVVQCVEDRELISMDETSEGEA